MNSRNTRRPLLAANWKMHKTAGEARQFVRRFLERVSPLDGGEEIVICPPFTAIHAVAESLAATGIGVGAQNVHPEPEGAYTGEISVPMLLEAGCRWVIVGHSERRRDFGETDQMVNAKLRAALSGGLCAIVCVGETAAQRKAGAALDVVSEQVRAAFRGLDVQILARQAVVAYEPVWAIGTGATATPEDAARMAAHIREVIAQMDPAGASGPLRVLYGGSVHEANLVPFLDTGWIDGALVGGASLSAEGFARMVECLRKWYRGGEGE
jgi:triosephosphate isomerase